MQRFLIQSIFLATFLLWVHTRAFAQEFTYDANGSLKTDGNKQISSIHYNHLNLVDTILYADGRKMIYTYSASGQKLREQSFLANGTVKQKRDYSGHILYRNDSLREIQNEDGRTVPIIPGNTATAWEYQYHLTDHLGNVRSLLTSKQETAASVATYEITSAATEQSDYLRYTSARKINSALFDHTHTGTTHYSERLNGSANEKYGIARSLSVMPGDTIKLEAYAKYLDPNKNNWTQALNTLVTQIASGTAPVGTMIDGAGYATNGTTPFPFAGLNSTSSSSGSGPKAYLNWLVFDRNYIFKNGGYVKLSEAAKENGSNVKHEKLEKQLTIREAGYVYVYLSNEEATPVEVYFDDVSVTQVKGPVIQEIDYDSFGLTFNEYSRENTALNNFLYNGKEQQKDFDLNWYDYGARMYDAALGRWHVIDPMAEKYVAWSPYNYVMNNPIRHVDPDGKDAEDPNGADIPQIDIDVSPESTASIADANKQAIRDAIDALNETQVGRAILEESQANAINIIGGYGPGDHRERGNLSLDIATEDGLSTTLVFATVASSGDRGDRWKSAYNLGIELARLNFKAYINGLVLAAKGSGIKEESILGNPGNVNFSIANDLHGNSFLTNEYYGKQGSISYLLGIQLRDKKQVLIDQDNELTREPSALFRLWLEGEKDERYHYREIIEILNKGLKYK